MTSDAPSSGAVLKISHDPAIMTMIERFDVPKKHQEAAIEAAREHIARTWKSDRWVGAIPQVTRNHRDPTGCDTPTSIAASSLDRPAAINAQNRRRCSCRATAGRPGDFSILLRVRSERRRLVIATTLRFGIATTT